MTQPARATVPHILVVDDEPQNCRLLEALLRPEGYRTTIAATGELALAAVALDPPDLILLDVMMPGMDGYEVARQLKDDAATANVPIIMVSALADREARIRGLHAGAEDFLTKPIDKGELWLRVRNLLRLKDLSDRLQGHSSALELQVQERTADLHQLAHYDSLTCVPNRAYLYETLRKTLTIAAVKQWTVAVMFVDVDHFKAVNDMHGHAAGDALLVQFGGRLLESVRIRDTIGRLGGDEFALIVLLEGSERSGAAVVATKIRHALQAPFQLGDHEASISASIGIAVYPDDGEDPDTLLRNADAAMYRAKEAGRDTFRFFSASMNDDAALRLQVEAAARKRAESHGALALGLLDDMEAPTCAVDETGTITAVNRAWRDLTCSMAAVPAGIDIGTRYLDVFDGHDISQSGELIAGLQRLLTGDSERFRYRYARGQGEAQRCFDLVAFPLPVGRGAIMSHLDALTGSPPQQDGATGGSRDELTGLPDRTRLLELLTDGLTDADSMVAVACLGVDRLKQVNDQHGFAAGDELLRVLSDRAQRSLRHGDTLARLAGDEFVVIWPDVGSLAEAAELAQRLTAVFLEPFELPEAGFAVSVSACVGVALGGTAESGEGLVHAANGAMRAAKRRGAGQTLIHTDALEHAAARRHRVETEMATGIARDEFVLHYQLIVDLRERAVTGVEALVRWNHPDGVRMPDEFIPIAEDSGLIVPLGEAILVAACRQAAAWSAGGLDLTMAVNLSVRQVTDPNLPMVVQRALSQAGLAPDRLLLEITESAVIEDAEVALAALLEVDALGVGIAIDDFGTGYSSLLYLKRYPIHTLKIDRAFVSGMGVNPEDDAIVASIVSLGQAVAAACTAEGVETPQQAEALRALGCQSAQGYYFARPVPADVVPSVLQECELRMRLPLLVSASRSRTRHEVSPAVAHRARELQALGASMHTIAAALNAAGSRGPGGLRWSSSRVTALLAADPSSAGQPDRVC